MYVTFLYHKKTLGFKVKASGNVFNIYPGPGPGLVVTLSLKYFSRLIFRKAMIRQNFE